MSLMAIILWALHALSPIRRLQEGARYLLQSLVHVFADPQAVDWLCAYPDDPEGIARIERCLDDLHAVTDFLVYQKARAILGLRYTRWLKPRPAPPQRRRSQSFEDLFARFEACAIRFGDIERLARRRAWKLKRLLAQDDRLGAPPAHEAFTSEAPPGARCAASSIFLFATLPAIGAHRAGLRIRAPP